MLPEEIKAMKERIFSSEKNPQITEEKNIDLFREIIEYKISILREKNKL
jgi:hypothetical protein